MNLLADFVAIKADLDWDVKNTRRLGGDGLPARHRIDVLSSDKFVLVIVCYIHCAMLIIFGALCRLLAVFRGPVLLKGSTLQVNLTRSN